jgi:hypothetical protein
MVDTYKKGKDVLIIVWAAILKRAGALELIILERDFKAKKIGYTISSYLAILNEAIPTL